MAKKNMGKRHDNQYKPPKDEYAVDSSFSKIRRYRGENQYQITAYNNSNRGLHRDIYANSSTDTDYTGAFTSIDRADYYNLDEKITSLSNRNVEAHDNLRKEIKQDIKELDDSIKNCISKKMFWTIIGVLVPIIMAVCGGIINQLSIANKNKDTIIEMRTTIDKSIIPTVEDNKKCIERNFVNIKDNTEKIIQIQNKK